MFSMNAPLPLADNPLLHPGELPAFDRIRPEHVLPALQQALQQGRERVAALSALPAPTFATLVEPLEELRHGIARLWSPVGHLNAVMNSDALREVYNAGLPLLSEWHTDLSQNEDLCRAYQRIADSEGPALDGTRRRVLEHALRDFRLAGVSLPAARKARFKELMLQLTQLQAKFEENVLDATNAWSHHVTDATRLDGLNEAIVARALANAKDKDLPGWLLLLDQPTYVAVMTDATSQELRRAFYEAWTTRASDQGPGAGRWDNSQVMEDILRLRHEAARLLDFGNFADYALATRMARSVDEVQSFLQDLARTARPAAEREFAQLTEFAQQPLSAWDTGFWSERLQHERFDISQEELRPYFQLPRVLEGLFGVATRLFGVSIQERGGVATWHPDVRFFDILDDGQRVGSFYLDAHARPGKRSGAWMDECVGRKRMDANGQTVLPVAYLVCNGLPPAPGQPALLTHDDVVTLFHEFGHGLHHMLTRIGYPSLAGINGVAWDAVELPSQFMENFAWHPQVLGGMSAHVETGAPLPEATLARLTATRSFQAGLMMMRQLEFALFDMRMHAGYDPARGGRIGEVLATVRAAVAVVPVPAWNRFAHSFGHIFAGGYAAGYYSYKWAEVLAADAFEAFEERGVFDRDTARRFLDSILSRGGSRDELTNFVEFRGRKPEVGPLLRQSGIAA